MNRRTPWQSWTGVLILLILLIFIYVDMIIWKTTHFFGPSIVSRMRFVSPREMGFPLEPTEPVRIQAKASTDQFLSRAFIAVSTDSRIKRQPSHDEFIDGLKVYASGVDDTDRATRGFSLFCVYESLNDQSTPRIPDLVLNCLAQNEPNYAFMPSACTAGDGPIPGELNIEVAGAAGVFIAAQVAGWIVVVCVWARNLGHRSLPS